MLNPAHDQTREGVMTQLAYGVDEPFPRTHTRLTGPPTIAERVRTLRSCVQFWGKHPNLYSDVIHTTNAEIADLADRALDEGWEATA